MEPIAVAGMALIRSAFPEMLSEPVYDQPRSSEWERVRDAFVRAHPNCLACGSTVVEVHHIRPFHLFPELELVTSNFMSLCRVHHYTFGHFMDWQAWNPKVMMMVINYHNGFSARFYGRETAGKSSRPDWTKPDPDNLPQR
jgi:hypothetical protein